MLPRRLTRRAEQRRGLARRERLLLWVPFIVIALSCAWHFPYATDDPVRPESELAAFYATAYEQDDDMAAAYAAVAQGARLAQGVREGVEQFVREYRLQDGRVLDVGSGDGYLQDVVADYTGLDVSISVSRHYHKPFVHGTATAMPFENSTFDAIWTIWVLEHVPNPEAALAEMRRVVKPGGLLYLRPAWNCVPWAAEGYAVRPFSDFGLTGRAVKASLPARRFLWRAAIVPNRIVRALAWPFGPTRLHYRRLDPNYSRYWQGDSDAVASLDPAEVAMWYRTRGDTCENCPRGWRRLFTLNQPLIIRVNKS